MEVNETSGENRSVVRFMISFANCISIMIAHCDVDIPGFHYTVCTIYIDTLTVSIDSYKRRMFDLVLY